MPSELMDERRGFSPLYVPPSAQPSSFYSYEIHFPTERQVGFWKPESVPDHGGIEGMALKLGNEPFASPTIEKKLQPSLGMINSSKCADSHFLKEQNARFSLEDLWKPSSDVFCRSDLLQQPANYANGNKTALNVVRSENNLLSNSLSELFNKKVSLTSNDTFFGNSVDATKFNFDEDDGLFESLKEMEAQTIGNLLPNDDDLLDYIAQPNTSDDVEEDIFCSIGGMEIEEVDRAGGCEHPSKPLFVRTVNTDSSNMSTLVIFNLDSSVSNENLYQIFGAYGQIKEIREAPHKKFIDFYDVRASEAAFHALNMREIAGKRIKLEKYCHSGTTGRSLKQIFSHEPQKDEIGGFHQQASKNTSLTGSYGPVSTGNTTFNGIPSTAPHSFSPIRSPSIGNHGNFDFHPMPNFHPHSLPECHDNMIPQGIPYNSVNSTGFGGHSFEHSEMVIGASGNRRYPQHQFAGNNNSFHAPSVPMMWPNSSQFHGYSTPPPHMLYPGAHHVGSAPTANPSMVSMGFSSSPTPHHNVFPCINGNFMEPPIPQQRCHIFHGNGVIAMPSAFDAPNDCVRSRRNDSNTGSNQADSKRQYELDIGLIISGKDSRTTLMIKNIPNKYTSKMLLAAIDENHRGTYDFVYLPIDFKNKCNVGYAFINIIDPLQIIPFHKAFNGKKWEKFNSEKVASLAYARIQGKAALVAHFQNSSLMNEDKRCRPILFHSDGPNAGDQEPFPTGINIRPRLGRSRNQLNHNNEDHHHHYYHHHQDSPLNSSTEENST